MGGEGFAINASVIKADASRARGVPSAQASGWTEDEAPTRAVREYLQALDAANPTTEDEPPSTPPKNISLTDPQARWTAARGGPAFYAYSTNYLIDLDAGIILDAWRGSWFSAAQTSKPPISPKTMPWAADPCARSRSHPHEPPNWLESSRFGRSAR